MQREFESFGKWRISSSSSSSSIFGAGGNPAYRTSAFEGICTLTPVLVPPFISRGAPHQTAWETSVSERRNYGREMASQIQSDDLIST
jgi:hypothetical protein